LSYSIRITPSAERDLKAIAKADRRRIGVRIEALAEDPMPPGSKQLVNSKPRLHRIRVGDYRVVYEIRRSVLVVLVVKIGHRKDVYR